MGVAFHVTNERDRRREGASIADHEKLARLVDLLALDQSVHQRLVELVVTAAVALDHLGRRRAAQSSDAFADQLGVTFSHPHSIKAVREDLERHRVLGLETLAWQPGTGRPIRARLDGSPPELCAVETALGFLHGDRDLLRSDLDTGFDGRGRERVGKRPFRRGSLSQLRLNAPVRIGLAWPQGGLCWLPSLHLVAT